MQTGVEAAAKDLGVEVVTQIPQTWGVEAQTPILDAMVARGDLDYIVTAPTDKDQMIGPLKAAVDAGIKVITVDTFLGDGDYVNGPVTFPISYIGSDNVEGGRISARGLAKAIGGKGIVYINSTNPNVSSVEGREQGFKEVMEKEFPDIKVLGPDYNLDDQNKATQQTAAVLEREPDLAGVFGTNVFSAQGAGTAVVNAGLGGHVQVVAYDATQLAIELMNNGVVSLVLAQKPFDMVTWLCSSPRPMLPASRACRVVSRPGSPSSTRITSKTRRLPASSIRFRPNSGRLACRERRSRD
ncbi:ABC transporter substrate-binding protein [Mesorhizobium sp. M0923]|uniref:ABC transporter substrate-binding protein n=1 Tax=Mesorhizobium sp. M0923 TaxID=2957028 RepID=UPI00333B70AE